jgi:putative ABC transport system substrate-binding protein
MLTTARLLAYHCETEFFARKMNQLFAPVLAGLLGCLGSFGTATAADTQRLQPRHVGVLLVSLPAQSKQANAFRQGLSEAGYTEGRDVVIEWRLAGGDYDQVPLFVVDLVQRKVDVIVSDSAVAGRALKVATSTIPIVIPTMADPVGSGLVKSIARPGGNITGSSLMTTELGLKRLQLLREAMPRLKRVALIWNPDTPFHPKVIADFKAAAPRLSIELAVISMRSLDRLGPALSAATRAHAQALYFIEDSLFFTRRATIIKEAYRTRLPVIYMDRAFTEEGGLMSYGPRLLELWNRSAGYVDKILKGANPADLPVEQPTKFELVVNLKTAKALGITIPESVLLRADEVIR